jgi:hypothetical protein
MKKSKTTKKQGQKARVSKFLRENRRFIDWQGAIERRKRHEEVLKLNAEIQERVASEIEAKEKAIAEGEIAKPEDPTEIIWETVSQEEFVKNQWTTLTGLLASLREFLITESNGRFHMVRCYTEKPNWCQPHEQRLKTVWEVDGIEVEWHETIDDRRIAEEKYIKDLFRSITTNLYLKHRRLKRPVVRTTWSEV